MGFSNRMKDFATYIQNTFHKQIIVRNTTLNHSSLLGSDLLFISLLDKLTLIHFLVYRHINFYIYKSFPLLNP